MSEYQAPKKASYDSSSAGTAMGQYGFGLFSNWDTMSPYQKSLALAHMGINGYNLAYGDYSKGGLYGTQIEATKVNGSQALTVGDGLNLAGYGLDLYNTVKNWNSVDSISRLYYGGQTVKNAADAYDIYSKYMQTDPGQNVKPLSQTAGYGGLSAGLSAYSLYSLASNWDKMSTGSKVVGAVSGVSSAKNLYDISKAGYTALSSTASTQAAAQGTSQVASQVATQGAEQVAAQAGTQAAGQVGTEAAGSTLDAIGANIIPGAQLVTGAYGMYQGGKMAAENWGTGGQQGRTTGALAGGTAAMGAVGAMAAVYGGLAAIGPVGWAAAGVIFAASMIGGSVKTGKSTDQGQRDMVRNTFKKTNSIADDQYNITLSNGVKANIGIDGHGGYRDATNPDQIHGGGTDKNTGGNKLQAFDVDYTNDLDYFAGTGGITLSRMLNGGSGNGHMAAIDQVGGQVGNAILAGTTGFGKEFTKDNFNTVKTELLGQYAKAGIKTKDDAFALINEMAKQKRINADEQISMNQMANMIYDKDGYELANKIYANRQQAVNITADKANGTNTSNTTVQTPKPAQTTPAAPSKGPEAPAPEANASAPQVAATQGAQQTKPAQTNNAETAKQMAAAANAEKYRLQQKGASK